MLTMWAVPVRRVPADAMARQVLDAAARLAGQLGQAGSPLAAVTAARELSATADAALQESVDRARARGP